jgi:hypothetical protein
MVIAGGYTSTVKANEDVLMKRTITALTALGFALSFGHMTLAQQAEPPPVAPPAAEAPDPVAPDTPEVSSADLETFVEIYVDLQETVHKYETELAAAETAEEAQDVQERIHEESVEKIAEYGWNIDRYNSVAQTVNSNPELVQRAVRMIEERMEERS